MKLNQPLPVLLPLACLNFTLSASHAATVLIADAGGTATYFEVSTVDKRVNNDLVRVGGNNGGTFAFIGLIAFDVSGSVAELNSATSITLGFNLAAHDNAPALDQIAIDYIGTFASNDLGVNGVNSASANAITIGNAPSIASIFSGPETTGSGKTYDATAISTDAFSNQYAFFAITDPNGGAHQWDIPAGSPTLTIVPEPSTGLLFGLAGLALAFHRRK